MKRALLAVLCFALCALPCAAAGRPDSPSASVFALVIPGASPVVLQKCSDIGSRNVITEFRTGGDVTTTHKLPGQLSVLNITCSRTLSDDKSLAQWRLLVEDATSTSYRKSGALVLYDNAMREVARWNLFSVWPAELTVRVDETSGIAMENVVLAVERIERP